ncbi:MAG: glycoside hydrolase family 38 C-terminal domain-containing protein [Candidatus Hermodarchaeota archaeon]
MTVHDKSNQASQLQQIFIVPHTHWDREWYLPFQRFRFRLVQLMDQLLEILAVQDYYFMLDGQTIVLEDYLEIRPEKKSVLLKYIREGKLAVGPWYLLPDEWLVGQESLIRNLEYSFDLAKTLEIPLMQIGYLPDQFGHTRAIPQLLGDLTSFSSVFLWRGVGPEVNTVPFIWKSDQNSTTSILGVYMPFGYGNAATLSENLESLIVDIRQKVDDLKPFSPVPVYLLMNGTDHQFPHPKIQLLLKNINIVNTEISLNLLDRYLDSLKKSMEQANYFPPEYTGEFRSSARAHLLQDTYSARMWIKQWDNKIEDLLVHYSEPLNTYLWYYLEKDYPTAFLIQAWKWLLKNQPHDSICGCSIDQTHDEMKSRYYWAENLAESTIEDALSTIKNEKSESRTSSCLVFNPSSCLETPIYFEFTVPLHLSVQGLQTEAGHEYEIQSISSSEDLIFENTFSPFTLRSGLKLLPGRKLMDEYVNEVIISDGADPSVCEIRLICDKEPIGELNIQGLKKQVIDIINSKKYHRFHVLVTRGTQQTYGAVIPLIPWGFTRFNFKTTAPRIPTKEELVISKNKIINEFYHVTFNKDGSFDLKDKKNDLHYSKLHIFEDWGDRGDEYTFGRLGPEKAEITNVKRNITVKGPLFCEICQTLNINTFREVDSNRQKRIGRALISVTTKFRFYRDLPRIDITTELTNTAKDHRLRICFDLPFKSSHTITSTHFGYVKRSGDPIGDKSYMEAPSGIQPQKRFIRAENEENQVGVTLMNQGLPEVELVNGSRLALTLIRAVGYLSRSDFPERQMHAGPFLATPGAQELDKNYVFKYSFLIQSKNEPIYISANHSEAFTLIPMSITYESSSPPESLLQPLIQIDDPQIRISSLRVRQGKIWLTLFNLKGETVLTKIQVPNKAVFCSEITLDGTIKGEREIKNRQVELEFKAYEIKILTFSN